MYVTETKEMTKRRDESLRTKANPSCGAIGCESAFGKLALHYLSRAGFRVLQFSLTGDVIQRMGPRPALILIEITTSGRLALNICQGIRRRSAFNHTPVILLSSKASSEECALGIESGADDYITGSSTGLEILARVRAIIRRCAQQSHFPGTPLKLTHALPYPSVGSTNSSVRAGDIEIDNAAMAISVRGSEISTTSLEFRLLRFLVCNEGRVFSRTELLDAVWEAGFVELRSVDACIRRLRRKIEPKPPRPAYLRTVRGAGYCLIAGSPKLSQENRRISDYAEKSISAMDQATEILG